MKTPNRYVLVGNNIVEYIGKTLAFLLPAIERLHKYALPAKDKVSILVLSPTRELALQVSPIYTLEFNVPFLILHVCRLQRKQVLF